MTTAERINHAFARLGLSVDQNHVQPVRGRADLLVIAMRYGYHVCANSADLVAFIEGVQPDPSLRNLVETINYGLDPFLVPNAVRDRVRWTATGGHGPQFYDYSESP